MIDELNSYQPKHNLSNEIYKGFTESWIFIIPLDLSFVYKYSVAEQDLNNLEINLNLSENIGLNFLPKDLVYFISKNNLISSEKESIINIKKNQSQILYKEKPDKGPSNLIKTILPFNQENEARNLKERILKDKLIKDNFHLCKMEKEKEEDKSIKMTNLMKKNNTNGLYNDKNNGCPLSQIQNYNINIYNPYINYVNICCPSPYDPFSSLSEQDNYNNKNYKDSIFKLSENENIEGKLPFNIYCENNKDINNIVGNISFNKNDNNISFLFNNSKKNFNNLEGNFSTNYSQKELENQLILNNNNNNINGVKNNIPNDNKNSKKNTNKSNNPKVKKNKKKKKKKIDDEYTVEMFGRRGWICQGCNNFNYESRKNCNRCKIPKKPLKKSLIMDNKGNKILDSLINTNHKDDWNCYNCGNVNYAFRLTCNRCQIKKELSTNENNYEFNKEEK